MAREAEASAAVEGGIDPGLPSPPPNDPGLPPAPMTPEMRDGFLIRKAADYGVAPADFDGDGKADLSIKLDGGTWRIDYSGNGFGRWDKSVYAGGPSSVPVPADYDGDLKADLAVKENQAGVNQGVWRVDYACNGFGTWDGAVGGYGGHTMRAVPARYDDDLAADMAVKDDLTGLWSIDYAVNGFGRFDAVYPGFGGANADPVPADYDRDGRADLAVKDDTGRWRIDFAADGYGNVNISLLGYGDERSHAVPADYDGDRRADLAVKRDDGMWLIDFAVDGFGDFDLEIPGAGGTTARAIPADYDGNGQADLGVRVDCGPWFIDHAARRATANGFGAWNQRFGHMTASDVVTATDTARLVYTLASDFTGTVFIPSNTTIALDGFYELPVKSCVQIRGTRHATDPGPLLYMDDEIAGEEEPYSLFRVTGHDVRIQGVRLRGPSNGETSSSQKVVSGIKVDVDTSLGLGGNVAIEGNEAWYWTGSAVTVVGQVHGASTEDEVQPGTPRMRYGEADFVRIARNSLHHNSMDSKGYGVSVGHGAYAKIEGNVFTYNRHAVASGGEPYSGYVAHYNYVLEGGFTERAGFYNQHFDVHGQGPGGYGGLAGERYEIMYNTVRGEQDYALGSETRPVLLLRGIPSVGAFLSDNFVVHDSPGEAINIKAPECHNGYGYVYELCNLTVGWNAYNAETSEDLAVGDFDGDGLDDVFLANGTAWWYSSAGRTEWRFLRASPLRIAQLGFGRFDSDARTDVVFSTGSEWLYSSAGVGNFVPLRVGGTAVSQCVFGHFDDNGRTDALYATGSTWFLSTDSSGRWATIRASTAAAQDLRVGDFDNDGIDEVFAVEDGRWVVWRPGWIQVYQVNDLTTSAAGLVAGDFDGDGYDDIAQTNGTGWRYSRRASSPWAPLRDSGDQGHYKDITAVLVGRFTPDDHDDALRYELVSYWGGTHQEYKLGTRFVGWDGTQDAFRLWSPEYVR